MKQEDPTARSGIPVLQGREDVNIVDHPARILVAVLVWAVGASVVVSLLAWAVRRQERRTPGESFDPDA